jgi:AcrR family transcriptional regulator
MTPSRVLKSQPKKALATKVARRRKPSAASKGPSPAVDEVPRQPQQDRGQRRVDSIIDAAEEVFVEVGVDAATTNAIAERAGASVGSLYHFFPSKDAILLALVRRYAERLREANARAMPLELVSLPLDELFERIVNGQCLLLAQTPAFDVVQEAVARKVGGFGHEELDDAIMRQVRRFIQVRLPRMSAQQREAATRLSVKTVGIGVKTAVTLPAAERETLLAELKDMLVRYFTPLDAAFGTATPKR